MCRRRLGQWVRYRNIENEEVLQANTNTYLAVKNTLGTGSSRIKGGAEGWTGAKDEQGEGLNKSRSYSNIVTLAGAEH